MIVGVVYLICFSVVNKLFKFAEIDDNSLY